MSDKTSDKISDNRLLSCPFCGEENIISTYNNFVPALLCGSCGAMITVPWDFNKNIKEELQKKWNTRKPMDRIAEKLEEAKQKHFVTGITANPYEFGACHAMDIAIKIGNCETSPQS